MSQYPKQTALADTCKLAIDSWALWQDAAMVVWLRSMRLAGGGVLAQREARRMVSEKVAANWQLGMDLLARPAETPLGLGQRSVRHYVKRVQQNRRRLSR